MDLWDRRVISDPKTLLRAMRFGNWDILLEEHEKLEDVIYLDIKRIKDGKAPEITPFQNHMEYVSTMMKWINSPEWLRLTPERKALSVQVVEAHLKFILPQATNMGEPLEQTNQAGVGTPFGASKPVGAA